MTRLKLPSVGHSDRQTDSHVSVVLSAVQTLGHFTTTTIKCLLIPGQTNKIHQGSLVPLSTILFMCIERVDCRVVLCPSSEIFGKYEFHSAWQMLDKAFHVQPGNYHEQYQPEKLQQIKANKIPRGLSNDCPVKGMRNLYFGSLVIYIGRWCVGVIETKTKINVDVFKSNASK